MSPIGGTLAPVVALFLFASAKTEPVGLSSAPAESPGLVQPDGAGGPKIIPELLPEPPFAQWGRRGGVAGTRPLSCGGT